MDILEWSDLSNSQQEQAEDLYLEILKNKTDKSNDKYDLLHYTYQLENRESRLSDLFEKKFFIDENIVVGIIGMED